MSLETFSSLEVLKYITFWDILKTGNIFLLDKNYTKEKKYSKKNIKELETLWIALYDDYYERKDNVEAKYYLKKNFEKLILNQKLILLEDLLNRCLILLSVPDTLGFKDFIVEKKSLICKDVKDLHPKSKLNVMMSIDDIFTYVESLIKSYKNLYNEKHKVVDDKISKTIKSATAMIVAIGNSLNIRLNVADLTVSEFLEWEKLAIKISKERNGK